jgi:hypothetical protein
MTRLLIAFIFFSVILLPLPYAQLCFTNTLSVSSTPVCPAVLQVHSQSIFLSRMPSCASRTLSVYLPLPYAQLCFTNTLSLSSSPVCPAVLHVHCQSIFLSRVSSYPSQTLCLCSSLLTDRGQVLRPYRITDKLYFCIF